MNQRHRSDSGAIGVGTVILLGVLGLLAYVLVAAFEADPTHYGRVPIPSEGETVRLPDGATDIYYAAATEETAALALPEEGLNFNVVDGQGEAVRTDSLGGDPVEIEGGLARVVGVVHAPEEATYVVNVTTQVAPAEPRPQLTFGQSSWQSIQDRFESVVEELRGPTGIVVAVTLLLLFLAPRLRRAMRES